MSKEVKKQIEGQHARYDEEQYQQEDRHGGGSPPRRIRSFCFRHVVDVGRLGLGINMIVTEEALAPYRDQYGLALVPPRRLSSGTPPTIPDDLFTSTDDAFGLKDDSHRDDDPKLPDVVLVLALWDVFRA
jgi:hypothetical protein